MFGKLTEEQGVSLFITILKIVHKRYFIFICRIQELLRTWQAFFKENPVSSEDLQIKGVIVVL